MSEPARPANRPRASHSFSIGRILGIDIRIHFTFMFLVGLFAIAGTQPEGPGAVGAVLWLIVIFTCVVIHELAHCVVGRRRGAVVHEIVLLPIGGVSRLEKLPEGPADEFAMAIAGPAASAGIAVVGAVFCLALGQPLTPIELFGGPLLPRLVWFNLIIAAFNLLPAFPLDGGRVFRALLERRYDLEAATKIAAHVGRWMAVAFMAVGFFWNIWFLIIGVFVYFGAAAEEAATIIHVRLGKRLVGDVMVLDPITLHLSATNSESRALVRRTAQRVFPVVGAQGYEGVVDADAIERGDPNGSIIEIVERAAPVLAATDGLEACLPFVVSAPAHALAVVDTGNRVVGVLRSEDIERVVAGAAERRAGTKRGSQ